MLFVAALLIGITEAPTPKHVVAYAIGDEVFQREEAAARAEAHARAPRNADDDDYFDSIDDLEHERLADAAVAEHAALMDLVTLAPACRGPFRPLSPELQQRADEGRYCAAPTIVRRFPAAWGSAPAALCPHLSPRGSAVVIDDMLYVHDERAVLDALETSGLIRVRQ